MRLLLDERQLAEMPYDDWIALGAHGGGASPDSRSARTDSHQRALAGAASAILEKCSSFKSAALLTMPLARSHQ